MMQDKAVRRLGALSFCLVFGAFAACAGSETPQVSDDFERAIADTYGNGSTGVAGAGSAGRGGSGGRGGGANAGSAGSAGSSSAGGNGGAPAGECNGFAILKGSCDGAQCHGAGSLNGNFAESEEIAAAFAGEDPVTAGCSMEGPLINTENPRGSLLLQKVNGTVPCGSPMPLTGPLDDDDVDCLEQWISEL